MTVAMALGAAVQPLTNSAPSTRRRTRAGGRPSSMLQDNAFQDVGYILTAVGGVLHVLVELPPFDDPDHVRGVLKELPQGLFQHLIGGILQAVQLHAAYQHLL